MLDADIGYMSKNIELCENDLSAWQKTASENSLIYINKNKNKNGSEFYILSQTIDSKKFSRYLGIANDSAIQKQVEEIKVNNLKIKKIRKKIKAQKIYISALKKNLKQMIERESVE